MLDHPGNEAESLDALAILKNRELPYRLGLPPGGLWNAIAALLLSLLFVGALASSVPNAFAVSPGCGATITTSTTLSSDVGPCTGNGLVIGADDITLDCAGHTITGSDFQTAVPSGVYLNGVQGVTVKNCHATNFLFVDGAYGIDVVGGSGNSLIGNTANGNTVGFRLRGGFGDTLDGNIANGNSVGFGVVDSKGNTLTGNTANENGLAGFLLRGSGSTQNVLEGNTANGNNYHGFFVILDYIGTPIYPAGNTLTDNTADGNGRYGFADQTFSLFLAGLGTAGTTNRYSSNECVNNVYGSSTPLGLCSAREGMHTTSTVISPNPATVSVGDSITLTATVIDTGCNQQDDQEDDYQCSDTTGDGNTLAPTGTVEWMESGGTGGAIFKPGACTLSPTTPTSSTCSVTYYPTPPGLTIPLPAPLPVSIISSYRGDSTHLLSSGSASLAILPPT